MPAAGQWTGHAADGPWLERWLSPPRFGRYVLASGGDRVRALALYEWNAQLAAALQRDLAHVEVGLRNRYAAALDAHWPGPNHWTAAADVLFAPVWRSRDGRWVDVNERNRLALLRARREAGRGAAQASAVVARLMFGFWRYLSSAAHEKTLWVPYLHHGFPQGTDRARDVDAPVGRLYALRNRVAHHEPLLDEDIRSRSADLLHVAGLVGGDVGDHIAATSTVGALLVRRP